VELDPRLTRNVPAGNRPAGSKTPEGEHMTLDKTQQRLDALQMANEGRLFYDGDATYYIRDEFEELAAALCTQPMQVAGSEVLAEELIEGAPLSAVIIDGEQLVPLNLTGSGVGTLALWQS
jgi:hypothetical protein